MTAKRAPSGIDRAGRAVWRSVTSRYELRPDELITLEDIAHLSDVIADLDRLWREAGRPALTAGSMGQDTTHPLVVELRNHRMARNTLLRQLKLPDEPAGTQAPNQHRQAAQSRWAAEHGKGA